MRATLNYTLRHIQYNPTIEPACSLYDGVFHVLVQTTTTHENLKLWQSLQALTYKSPSRLGNLTTCGWVSGKRYTADMSSHITASLTCAQRLTLHVYCLLSSDFTHITLNFRSYLQHILICPMYCPAVHQYVQYIERGVYFCIPDLGFEYTHIQYSICFIHCAVQADVHLVQYLMCTCTLCAIFLCMCA